MLKNNVYVFSSVLCLFVLVLAACSSNVIKADIPGTANPQEEITRLDQDLSQAVLQNVDVLASQEYNQATKWQEEAKSDLASKEKQEEILDDVRTARGHLNKATQISQGREQKAAGLFQSRQSAIAAGAKRHATLNKQINAVDSDVSGLADSLDKASTEKLTQMQGQYVDLERQATILTQLGQAHAIVEGSRKDGAAKRAPLTFKKAEMSLKTAETVISTNVRNPPGFQMAVIDANKSATLLNDVMFVLKQNGKGLSEESAMKMVAQAQQIKNLKSNLSDSETMTQVTRDALLAEKKKLSETNADLSATRDDLSLTEKNLATTQTNLVSANQNLDTAQSDLSTANKDLTTAQASVAVQRGIENARKQFSSDEAEAYQQGGNILIRLKKMNFASGNSALSGSSLPLLAKVSAVAKSLNATEIKVEGHTDSVGGAVQNKAISEARATTVATYFKANGFQNIDIQSAGYGFEKPIATNKSKDGRSQNRRVDIIITPEKLVTQ